MERTDVDGCLVEGVNESVYVVVAPLTGEPEVIATDVNVLGVVVVILKAVFSSVISIRFPSPLE